MGKEDGKLRKRKDHSTKNDSNVNPSEKKKTGKYEGITRGTQAKHHKLWTSFVIVCAVTIVGYFLKPTKEVRLAVANEIVPYRFHKRDCSEKLLDEIKDYPNCVPKQCGRFVTDTLITPHEVNVLYRVAENGIALAGSAGGASILDLHSGALSKEENFINAYSLDEFKKLLTKDFIDIYQSVTEKIKKAIAENFLVNENSLYLTHPTFFSRITNVTARTVHDEYWHPHVDKEQYESFHYTSLLYLNTNRKDFTGGRFIFVDGKDKNETKVSIEPKSGRVNAFTSGHENVHHIEKVMSGIRYAITVSFTCNSALKVSNNFTSRFQEII